MSGRAADLPSLWRPLDRAGGEGDVLLAWHGGDYTRWSWDDWRARALAVAGGLRARGVEPGDRVACLLTNSADACATVLGVWFAGGCLVSLPMIARGMDAERYVAQLQRIVADAAPALLLADDAVVALLSDAGLGVPLASFRQTAGAPLRDLALPASDDEIFVQYSSGSTTEPKGCVLTAGAVAWQLASLERALDIDPEADTGVVWLPMSHDMGLFGCVLLTYWTSHRLVLGTPERFLARPHTWLDDCARFGATVSAAPGFGLALAARMASRRPPPPLRLRRLVLGGDRIDPDVLDRATAVLGDSLPPSSLVPAYGLAEVTLAATMTPIDRGAAIASVDTAALAVGELAPLEPGAEAGGAAKRLVSAGPPLPGVELRIRDGAAAVGEIVVDSPSLAAGYLGAPAATAERFTADGLRTGDLGFVLDGELYVTGRIDDMIAVAGRNVYARDIEAALDEVPGVRTGACAVVEVGSDGGTPRLVAVVEPREPDADLPRLARALADASRQAAGLAIRECVFVPKGRLPKTPSGKIKRTRCREIAVDPDAGCARQVVREPPDRAGSVVA